MYTACGQCFQCQQSVGLFTQCWALAFSDNTMNSKNVFIHGGLGLGIAPTKDLQVIWCALITIEDTVSPTSFAKAWNAYNSKTDSPESRLETIVTSIAS